MSPRPTTNQTVPKNVIRNVMQLHCLRTEADIDVGISGKRDGSSWYEKSHSNGHMDVDGGGLEVVLEHHGER